MSVMNSLTISYDLNNGQTYLTTKSQSPSNILTWHYTILGLNSEFLIKTTTSPSYAGTVYLTLNTAAKNILYNGTTTGVTRFRIYGIAGGTNASCYFEFYVGSGAQQYTHVTCPTTTGAEFDNTLTLEGECASSTEIGIKLYRPKGSILSGYGLGIKNITIEAYFDNEPTPGINYDIVYCGNTLASGTGEESGIPAYYDGNEYLLYMDTVFNCKGCIMSGDLTIGNYNLTCGNKFMQDNVTVYIGGS